MTRLSFRPPSIFAMLALPLAGLSAQPTEPTEPIEGLDPVHLVAGREVQGDPEITSVRGRFRYSFASAETKARFEADPERYEIRYGGACARMRSANGIPDLYWVHEGAIYIFGSEECWRAFRAAPEDYLDPESEKLPADPAARSRGRQLIERAVTALGGAGVVDGLSSYRESGFIPAPGGGEQEPISTTHSRLFPDRARHDARRSFGEVSMILNPEGLYQVTRFGIERRLEFHRELFERQLARDPLSVLRARHEEGFEAVALADGGAGSPSRVAVDSAGERLIVGIDAETGLPATLSFSGQGPDWTFGEVEVRYSDYRAVDGLKVPFRREALFNGEPYPAHSLMLQSAEVDPELAVALFEPPPQESRPQ